MRRTLVTTSSRVIPAAVTGTEEQLLNAIKKLSVIPVALSVKRSNLLSLRQDHGENARSFFAKINGKAATCAYSIECSSPTCTNKVDFTNVIVKDVLITGLSDDEIKRDALGWADLDKQNVQETVNFIEAKEMARDALTRQSTAAAISSSYKMQGKAETVFMTKTTCKVCKTEMDKYSWSKRQNRMIECCSLCLPCWNKANPRKLKGTRNGAGYKNQRQTDPSNEVGAIIIGAVEQTDWADNNPQFDISPVESHTSPGKNAILMDHHILYIL